MAENYSNQSPYLYAVNNPILNIDYLGLFAWKDNGDGSWTAEAGDGAESLAKDANISREKAYKIMHQQGYGTYEHNGMLLSAVDTGNIVNLNENATVILEEFTDIQDYKVKEKEVQAEPSATSELLNYVGDGVCDILRAGDKLAENYGPKIGNALVDANPVYSIPNSVNTWVTGEDFRGNKKEGVYARAISPLISIGLSAVPGKPGASQIEKAGETIIRYGIDKAQSTPARKNKDRDEN